MSDLLISIRPVIKTIKLTINNTEKCKGVVSWDFNVPVVAAKIKSELRQMLPFVESVLKRHGGEILEDGERFDVNEKYPSRFSARILIRSTREALDELLLHPYVDQCGVLDPRNRIETETFILGMETKKAVPMPFARVMKLENGGNLFTDPPAI